MIQQDVILHEKTQTVYFMRNAIVTLCIANPKPN